MRWSHDGLSRGESLDCALSFFIKSGIAIVPSANHHRFTFFSVYKMEIEMRAVIFYYCRQGKGGKKFTTNYPTRTVRTHWVGRNIGYANLRRRKLTFTMKLDPGDH
jgi:hypothetical protein